MKKPYVTPEWERAVFSLPYCDSLLSGGYTDPNNVGEDIVDDPNIYE